MRHQQSTHGRDRFPNLRIVIPARAGSSRIHRKNLQEIVPGKSLLQWIVELYQGVLPGVPILVATEDHETSKLAVSLGCLLHGRCLDDIQDTRPGWAIFDDVMDCYPGETILLAQCTSPFTFRSEIERALLNPLPYVYSAYQGVVHTCDQGSKKSQELPVSTIVTGNFAIARQRGGIASIWSHEAFASRVSWISAIDINVQSELDEARLLATGITQEMLLGN